MKKILILFILTNIVLSQNAASYGAAFLRLGQSARQLSLGNSGRSDSSNDALFLYNASALAYTKLKKLSFNTNFLSQDRVIYSFSYQSNLKNKVGIALGWIYATVNELYSYDLNANRGEEIDYSDQAFIASFGAKFSGKLAFGVNLKYLLNRISDVRSKDYNSKGLSIDLSLMYQIDDKQSLAFIAKELVGSMNSNSEQIFEFKHEEDLLKQWILSYTAKGLLLKDLNTFIDFEYYDEDLNKLHLGVEYYLHKNFPLRVGYNNKQFTSGLGFNFIAFKKDLTFNYAYMASKYNDGDSHIISWLVRL